MYGLAILITLCEKVKSFSHLFFLTTGLVGSTFLV